MKKFLLFFTICLLAAAPITAYLAVYDPLVAKQWYLEKINAFSAWDITKGSREVVVAVLDTGVDTSHPDLARNIWVNTDEIGGDNIDNDHNGFIDDVNGWDFMYDQPDVRPDTNYGYDELMLHHGTFIAGIIAGVENGRGITGIASNVKIMPIKVLDEFGFGDTSIVADAIDYAVDNGADIINLSLSGYDDSLAAARAIERAKAKNVIVVAAAGNGWYGEGYDLDEDPVYPICYDSEGEMLVIGVGSSDISNVASIFSNYGHSCLDVSAPGEEMFSTKIHQLARTEDEYWGDDSSGTSFSTAVVSGTVALMRSINRSLTVEDVVKVLEKGAQELKILPGMETDDMGAGVIDAHNALRQVLLQYGKNSQRNGPRLLISPQGGKDAVLNIINDNLEIDTKVTLFDTEFAAGAQAIMLDINGDGNLEYAAAPEAGSPALLRILSLNQRLLAGKYMFEQNFLGGVNLGKAVIDGKNILLACSGAGRNTELLFIDETAQKIKSFFPFDDQSGCSVSAGDVNGDGIDELVIGSLGSNEVKVFDSDGKIIRSFIAYDINFSGVYVTVADLNADGLNEIITSPKNGIVEIKVFDGNNGPTVTFSAYGDSFTGGAKTAVFDFDKTGNLDIAVVPGPGGGPHLRVFDILGKVLGEKFIYDKSMSGGLNVSAWPL
ncbi:MAG TPA: S8 family serine peptidase [Candidatus Bipolaricaulota bacterium]|nr:S8 family serine peptidase [Candidatus Bipolaricaulota bacterium]